MSFPKYPEYKGTGVEWLGEVPAHWDVKAVKWLSPVLRGASPRPIDDSVYFDDEGEYAWVRIADVSASDGVLRETVQRLSSLGSSLSVKLKPGSLFLSIAGSVGKPCITEIKACIHDGFVYFPWLKREQQMLLFRIFELATCFGGLGKLGTQLNLNTDTVGGIKIAIPPEKELSNLLAFLDHETARIDALVEEQKRLIELLKEKRQAVISHAVTKGLDPNVPMKDPGVEWLGEVPAHWDVLRLESVYYETVEKGRYDLPVLRVSIHHGVSDKELTEEEADRKITRIEDREKYKRVRPGDLTYNMMRAWQGGFGAVLVNGLVSPAYVVCRPTQENISEFVEQQLRTSCAVEEMRRHSYGITDFRLRLYWDQFKTLSIALPPRHERQFIMEAVSREIANTQSLIAESERAIGLLQEHRSALISAAVTGKIDVRGWKPPSTAESATSTSATTEAV